MIVAQFQLAILGLPSLLAAGLDFAGIGSVIAAFTAGLALILGYRSTKRTDKTTEKMSYVDNNFKTMQVTLDWLKADNTDLRARNEAGRVREEAILEELRIAEEKLEVCERKLKACEEGHSRLLVRVKRLEKENDK